MSLLFTDTDSLTYEICTRNIYTDIQAFSDMLDTRLSKKNKVTGKFKDDLNGRQIYEFIGLCSKMHSIMSADGEKKLLKG